MPCPPPRLLVQDDFQHLTPGRWRIESEQPSRVAAENGQLLLDSPRGLTVWLHQPLGGAYRIEFQRQVLVADQPNDRLSDMNLFWAAHEPGSAALARRDGVLESYDSMHAWYVGMGGNGNTTTRFRHYDGLGARRLLGEHLERQYLLEAGRRYQIAVEVTPRGTRYQVDGTTVFEQPLAALPAAGYFGWRQVWSRQAISAFRVLAL